MNDIAAPSHAPKPKIKITRWIIIFLLLGGIGAVGFYAVKLSYQLLYKAQLMQTELNTLHAALAQQQLALQEPAPKQKNNNAPLLAEVTYLIKAANLVLLVENDIASALDFLTTAKQHLASKPEFLALSLAIDKDIYMLQTDAAVDVEKLIARLETLLQTLTTLNTDTFIAPPTATPPTTITTASWWRKLLNRTWQELQNALIIKHHDNSNANTLTLEQLAEAKLNIQFRVLQAEWALMHRNSALYQSSLKNAANWLHTSFPRCAQTDQLSKELQELQTIKIPTKLQASASMKELLNFK